jgi:hypothetical protein
VAIRLVLASVVLLSGVAHASSDPANVCCAKRLRTTAVRERQLLHCYAVAASRGVAVDPTCVATEGAALARSFRKIESGNACPGPGDEDRVQSDLERIATLLANALRPTSTASACASRKLKAAARFAEQLLHAAAKYPPHPQDDIVALLPLLNAFDQRLTATFASLDARSDCLTHGDAAAIEGLVLQGRGSSAASPEGAMVAALRLCPQCGDGTAGGAEECDGADASSCNGPCLADCRCPSCGDGVTNQPSEMCDGADDGACHGLCRSDCTCPPPVCGNGVKEAGEQCDGAALGGCASCQPDCTCSPPVCGNAVVEPGEECDQGLDNGSADSCCTAACQFAAAGTTCTGGTCSGATWYCIATVCGDGVVAPGEDCDPPDCVTCDYACHTIVPSLCGNGVVDPGEACEPPGVGGCGHDCQLAPCAPPGMGEIDVACTQASTDVAVGATPAGYLMTWTAQQQPQDRSDVVVRHFDPDGNPVDPGATVASAGVPCTADVFQPAVGSDGTQYYVVWAASDFVPDQAFIEAIYGRLLGNAGLDSLDSRQVFGMCSPFVGGPTTAGGVASQRFAVGWLAGGICFLQGVVYENPVGQIRSSTVTPVGLGFPVAPPPNTFSESAASVGTLGGDTLWVWLANEVTNSTPPYLNMPFVAAVWTDVTGSTAPLMLTGTRLSVGGRPAVAAGAASLLVVWRQGASDTSTTQTEIRAVRATRAAGNLDADGGLLLATTAGAITGGPVVAFDGTRWLVVWAEASGTSHDLRAVAVNTDGTVVDASPRLVASDVTASDPAVASAGDGRVAVLYGRPDGTSTAVRATIVTP